MPSDSHTDSAISTGDRSSTLRKNDRANNDLGESHQPAMRPAVFYAMLAALLAIAVVAHYWDDLSIWKLQSRAAQLSQASRDTEAVDQLREALLLDQSNPQTVIQLARAHRRAGHLETALNLTEAAEGLGAEAAQIELERILLAVQTGRTRGFEKRFAQLLVELPEQAPDIMRAYVLGLFANLQIEEALQLLSGWQSSTPQDPQPKFLEAYLYHGINRLDLAVAAYRAGLALSEDSTLMRRRLAQVLLETGEVDAAQTELQLCQKLAPDDIEVLYLLAQCAQQRNELDRALQQLDRVLAASSDHFEAHRLRGRILLDKGDWQRALSELQRVVTAHPDDIVAREALGRVLQSLGRTEEAKTHFDYVSLATRQQDETGRLIRQVLSEPQNAELRFEIGQRLLQAGDVEDGAKWLRTVLEVQPDHVAAQQALAQLLQSTRGP